MNAKKLNSLKQFVTATSHGLRNHTAKTTNIKRCYYLGAR